MQTAEGDGGISASGKRRRDRKRKMKRLGFEQVTLFVPRGEVRALKRDMALKEKVAEAKKALAEYEKVTGEQFEGEDSVKNKAGVDVLAGAKPSAPAAPITGTPQGGYTSPRTAPQHPYGTHGTQSPGSPHSGHHSPGAVDLGVALPTTAGPDISPKPEMTEQERKKLFSSALPSYMQPRGF
jgi:hypothetical protein